MPLPRFPVKHAVPPQLRSRKARALPRFAPLRYFLLQCFPLQRFPPQCTGTHEPLSPQAQKAALFRSFLFVPPAFVGSRMPAFPRTLRFDSPACRPPFYCRTLRYRVKQALRLSLRCLSDKPARVHFSSCLSSRQPDCSFFFNNCLLLNYRYVTTALSLELISLFSL